MVFLNIFYFGDILCGVVTRVASALLFKVIRKMSRRRFSISSDAQVLLGGIGMTTTLNVRFKLSFFNAIKPLQLNPTAFVSFYVRRAERRALNRELHKIKFD